MVQRPHSNIVVGKAELSRKLPNVGSQTASQPTTKSTPDLRKRPREPTESLEKAETKKPQKRLIASTKEDERRMVSVKMNPRERKRRGLPKHR